MKNYNNMTGRTMIETIGAIAVFGLIAAGIFKMSSSAINRYKLSRIGQQVIELQKVVNDRYMAKGYYNDLKFSSLNPDSLPAEIKDGKHSFGGSITTYGMAMSGEKEKTSANKLFQRRYYIQFSSLTPEACQTLCDMAWPTDSSTLIATYVGKDCAVSNRTKTTAAVSTGTSCAESLVTPIDAQIASTQCVSGAKMIWVFE